MRGVAHPSGGGAGASLTDSILDALDLRSVVDVDGLTRRATAYAAVHLGTRELPIGALLGLLRREPLLRPPRTGHLGNWEDILLGRAGAMDFNLAVCGGGFGYPLIYAFTQTEADGGEGDHVYLPGSLVERGRRTPLPLATWDGARFAARGRERPLFCPFVVTEVDGAPRTLVEVHEARMRAAGTFGFVQEAAAVVRHADALRPMLRVLLDEAAASANPRRALSDLFGRAVSPDGVLTRCDVSREGGAFLVDGQRFATAEALLTAALAPFEAVMDPEGFRGRVGGLPPRIPLLSSLLVGLVSALYRTHLPTAPEDPALTRPFNVHLHWGARDMAGYPPRRKGYFVNQATSKSLRGLCGPLVRGFAEVDPLLIVLLPASVFMLCPTDHHPRDAALLDELFTEVSRLPDLDPQNQEAILAAVEGATGAWLSRWGAELSPYFLHRFHARAGVLHRAEVPERSTPVILPAFERLSLRRACMVVGALVGAVPTIEEARCA